MGNRGSATCRKTSLRLSGLRRSGFRHTVQLVIEEPMPSNLIEDDQPLPDGFSSSEQALLRRYLKFYRSLGTGKRIPSTEAQRHSVAVCQATAVADSFHEKLYAKYMRLRPKAEPIGGTIDGWREQR